MPIPVHLITGLLGSGKTTAILRLLDYRPAAERWAIVVNDFGEVGIDGAVFGAVDGISVREINGGCLCCVGAMALRASLPRLLREQRPDRLLIEPSGLGHPAGLVDLLTAANLAEHLDLRAIINLLDPRRLADARLCASELFRAQAALADVLVATHADVASAADLERFAAFAASLYPPKAAIGRCVDGALDPAWLELPTAVGEGGPIISPHAGVLAAAPAVGPRFALPAIDAPQRLEHASDGRHACGWRFPASWVFEAGALKQLFDRLDCEPPLLGIERGKGVLRVAWDRLLFNAVAGDACRVQPLAWRRDSRAEFIAREQAQPDWDALGAALLACRSPAD